MKMRLFTMVHGESGPLTLMSQTEQNKRVRWKGRGVGRNDGTDSEVLGFSAHTS